MKKESDYQKFLELHVRSLSVELDDDGKFFGSLIDKEGNNFTYWSDIETIRKMLCNQSVLFNTSDDNDFKFRMMQKAFEKKVVMMYAKCRERHNL